MIICKHCSNDTLVVCSRGLSSTYLFGFSVAVEFILAVMASCMQLVYTTF